MNNVVLMGRLTADPEYRTAQSGIVVVSYTLAVERRFKKDGEPTADFIRCKAFGKSAEFAERYFKKGTKIAVTGRIQTGSYEKDGHKVYTTDVIIDNQEFAESKAASAEATEVPEASRPEAPDDFMAIPEDIAEVLPFM